MKRASVFAAVTLAAGVVVSGAAAQEGVSSPDSRDAEARGIFEAGRAAYSDGRFDEALQYFARAHELSGRAEMLYNVGSAAERAGELRASIDAFEAYLDALPTAGNRGEVEARLRALQDRLTSTTEGESTAPQPESSTLQDGEGPGALPVILIATGGAMTVGGVVLFLIGNAAIQRVADAPDGASWSDVEGDHDDGPLLANLGLVLGGVGIATAVTGVVLLGSSGDDAAVAVGPKGISVRGRF